MKERAYYFIIIIIIGSPTEDWEVAVCESEIKKNISMVILPFIRVFESGFIFFQVRKEWYAILVRKNFF